MDRRSFFPALFGAIALPRVLQRAPLPTDDVQVVSVPYVATPDAIGPASDYTITTATTTGVPAIPMTATSVQTTVWGFQQGDEWWVVEHGGGVAKRVIPYGS